MLNKEMEHLFGRERSFGLILMDGKKKNDPEGRFAIWVCL